MEFHRREDITHANHPHYFVQALDRPLDSSVRVKFLGVNSFWISDGTTHLMIDPYLTRPCLDLPWDLRAGSRGRRHPTIAPNTDIINRMLEAAGIVDQLRPHVFVVTHTHYDHALDIAAAWDATGRGARIYGSSSLRYVLEAYDESEGLGILDRYTDFTERPRVLAENGDFAHYLDSVTYEHGAFRITFLLGRHSPRVPIFGPDLGGDIGQEFVGLAREGRAIANDYREGGTYSVLIEHSEHGSVLNQGSANCVGGGYYRRVFGGANPPLRRPDVLILGIAGFNSFFLFTRGEREAYYQETVATTRPKIILFTHWDDLNIQLDQPMRWFHDSHECYNLFRDLMPPGAVARGTDDYQPLVSDEPLIGYLPIWEEITILPAEPVVWQVRDQLWRGR
jgi:hypothetical protein